MVYHPKNHNHLTWHRHKIVKEKRILHLNQKPCVLWFTGLSGSGKSTIANRLEEILYDNGNYTYLLDGDNIRYGLNKDLEFDKDSRAENIRRVGELCKLFVDSGLIVLSAFISPFQEDRERARSLVDKGEFIEIFVDVPLEVCRKRDVKGLYAKADQGLIKDFTGVTSPYEPPQKPEIRIYNHKIEVDQACEQIIKFLWQGGYLSGSPQVKSKTVQPEKLPYLRQLEAESIHIMREVVAEFEHPAMLYSIGKDSSVMLHLLQKAFYPASPPLPLVHVDTQWKFKEMIEFRDRRAQEVGLELIVYTNPAGKEKNISPFTHGSTMHTDIMKTQALRQMLDLHQFDAVFVGARRDEEKSRSKERIYSFRDRHHRWDPKQQRPELWNVYNGKHRKGESIRIFPLSNWTELDIWHYIYLENIPIPELYLAKKRQVVDYNGTLISIDDNRIPKKLLKTAREKKVRFRTLGCYPLTGAFESDADSVMKIIGELIEAVTSERQGRVIDSDINASMEKKKQEGYF